MSHGPISDCMGIKVNKVKEVDADISKTEQCSREHTWRQQDQTPNVPV